MPPRVATRTVRLRQPRLAAHAERMQLLTYPMALAQHGASVPLIQHAAQASGVGAAGGQRPAPPSSPLMHSRGDTVDDTLGRADGTMAREGEKADAAHQRTLPVPRRWVRDADELCIASIHRSNNINHINSYVATYKFEDPQWLPLLLPEVHVVPKSLTSTDTANATPSPSPPVPPTSPPPSSSRQNLHDFDVFIDYNKLTTLELVSRHANYALRHLVQKGHAMYFVNFAQHSIVQMRGLVEASYVSCAYGIRGERLRTHIIHTGPVDVRDIVEVDPHTQAVSFNFVKPHVRRGVVAVSTVEGYGTWFQRKPMLWQRTRRIGALQSQMGSYDYQLCDPAEVGRMRSYEVSLLAPHVRLIGAHGGAEAVALVASSQVAQNERLYMGQFEAPVLTAVDAVQQLAHRTALHHHLLRPAVENGERGTAAYENPQLQERRRLAGMERLLPVSWVTRTPPPYVPLESDLPFRIQMSRPSVIRADQQQQQPVAFPTGGAVGSPFVKGVPLSLFEFNIHQGVDHYIFDDAPSARPMKWWNQKSNMPYNGYLYAMRSGLLDYVEPAERIANPLATPSSVKATPSSMKLARRRRRRHPHARQSNDRDVGDTSTAEVSTSAPAEEERETEMQTSMALHLAGEALPAGASELVGHDDDARQAAALQWTEEGKDVAVSDRPPLHMLVAPNNVAQRRLRRYATRASATAADASSAPHQSAEAARAPLMPLEDRAAAVLRRQLRLRRLRKRKSPRQHETREGAARASDSAEGPSGPGAAQEGSNGP